jgi:hypothetical protein
LLFDQRIKNDGRTFSVGVKMEIMLTAIVTWLSLNIGLPANYEHPQIAFVSPDQMSAVRTTGVSDSIAHADDERTRPPGSQIVALYDDRNRTVYLPNGWNGDSPTEMSVLVHEMVHHLQNLAGVTYECAEAREKPAYEAQEGWLALYGRDFKREFRVDDLTMAVRTKCIH